MSICEETNISTIALVQHINYSTNIIQILTSFFFFPTNASSLFFDPIQNTTLHLMSSDLIFQNAIALDKLYAP